jgi:hypothetical protein
MTIPSRIRRAVLIGCSAIMLGLTASAPAQASAPPSFFIRSWDTSLCLGIQGGLKTPGTPAVIWPCNNHLDQKWHWGNSVTYNGFIYTQLVNGFGQCLGTNGGAINENVGLVSYTCLGATHPDQYWEAPIFNNCYRADYAFSYLYNYASVDAPTDNLLVIGTKGGVLTQNTPVVMWNFQEECNNQMWALPSPP